MFFLSVASSDLIWKGASCKQNQIQVRAARGTKVRLEMETQTEINAIFVECLCGDTGNDHLKHKPRVVLNGVWGCHYSDR